MAITKGSTVTKTIKVVLKQLSVAALIERAGAGSHEEKR